METILIILVSSCYRWMRFYYFGFYKKGKINDRDGDFVTDEIEVILEDVKEVDQTV